MGLVKDYDYLEGDDQQDRILNLILNIRNNQAIENLFIDVKMVKEFIPED